MADQPIIKKVKKVSGHGHHGGAWKVAYADFVTAMMAFFLLLWLLSSTSEEQKEGIAEYFNPTHAIVDGQSNGTSVLDKNNSIMNVTPFAQMQGGVNQQSIDLNNPQMAPELKEQLAFEQAAEALKRAIEEMPELKELADSILIDQTPEGLRIQLVDQDNHSMFPVGSAKMYPKTEQIIQMIAKVIGKMPNRISVGGHTDASPFRTPSGNGNWDLSAARASASRAVLERSGISDDRIYRVSGYADRQLLDKENPYSPRNRRLSILLLRENYDQETEVPEQAPPAE